MAQPRLGDAAVEHRVVHRVEHAVADAGHHRPAGQHPVALAGGIAQRRHAQQRQAAEQHRPRAVAVDPEARQRLHDAGDDEEDRQQEAQLRVADLERVLQPREQRRQQQLAEVADAVRQADQADDGGVAAQRRGLQGECGHGGIVGGRDCVRVTIDRTTSVENMPSPPDTRCAAAAGGPAALRAHARAAGARQVAPPEAGHRDRAAQPRLGAGGGVRVGRGAHHRRPQHLPGAGVARGVDPAAHRAPGHRGRSRRAAHAVRAPGGRPRRPRRAARGQRRLARLPRAGGVGAAARAGAADGRGDGRPRAR